MNREALEQARKNQPPPVGDEMKEEKFGIGSPVWPGLAKLIEECGEVIQIAGKIMAYPLSLEHPDGTQDIPYRLAEELADLQAIIAFVIAKNGMPMGAMMNRVRYKTERFDYWHHEISHARNDDV
jgi:NTP pyrophosphatase (non-canonical NTP hydrolase)